MKRNDYILSIVVTILAFPLSCLLKNIFPFDKLLSNNYVDVEYSDFYSAVAKSDSPSEDVAVVAINGYSRSELASLIDTLSSVADVICLDFKFAKPEDNDSVLISKIDNCKKIVLPYILKEDHGCYEITDSSYFYGGLISKSIHYGAVNINAKKNGGNVRRFKPEFKLKDGSPIDNFAVAAVRCSADSNRVKRLEALSDDAIRLINYRDSIPAYYVSDKPVCDSYEYQLLNNMEDLRGRIVLLGTDVEYSDRHSVPVYGNLSGVLIHAYTIQTILSGQYVRENIGWIDYPLALLVTFLFCMFVCFIRRKYAYAEGLFVRIVQLGLLLSFVIVGLFLFLRNCVYVSFSFCLLMMSMSILLLDIVSGFYGLTKNIRRK